MSEQSVEKIAPTHSEPVELLLRHIRGMSGDDIDAVAVAWHEASQDDRSKALAAIRDDRGREDVWDAAVLGRRLAEHAACMAGRHAPGFASAAWDATLALGMSDLLPYNHYATLAGAMSRRLPWLLLRAGQDQ